jgi:hypothetical protein
MMNRRAAYAAFEKMVLSFYEQKTLTLNLLDRIASRYCQIAIDSAGSRHVQTSDGKDLHQICIELVDPTFPIAARGSSADHEEYWERELQKWEEIVHKRWGWQAYCRTFPTPTRRSHAA